MKYEPTYLEIFLTRLAFLFYGKAVYQSFADSLPLKGGEQVLDFGCGMGTVVYYVAKRLPDCRLTCQDISERWLKACRKHLRSCGNVDFIKGDSSVLAKEKFDVVFCHFVLHDIPDSELEKIIPALAKSLRAGGRLAFREPLSDAKKVNLIKGLLEQNSLFLQNSRITDIPLMGNSLESTYVKK